MSTFLTLSLLDSLLNHWMMIDVLRPLLCTRYAKLAERPAKVMRRSERRNNLQICPRWDSNTGSSDMLSNTLPLDHGCAPVESLEGRSIQTQYLYIHMNKDVHRRKNTEMDISITHPHTHIYISWYLPEFWEIVSSTISIAVILFWDVSCVKLFIWPYLYVCWLYPPQVYTRLAQGWVHIKGSFHHLAHDPSLYR